jgi:dynein heavy chain
MHILLYQVLKPGEVVDQIKKYVNKALGEDAFNRPPVILKDVYDSKVKASTPILLLLTPGNDPMESISRLGEDKQRIPYHVSLGKGQSEKAKALIADVR